MPAIKPGAELAGTFVKIMNVITLSSSIFFFQMEKSFVIEVLNVHEPPVTIQWIENNVDVNENSIIGAVVGTLKAIDNEPSQNLTFNLDINTLQSFRLTTPRCASDSKTTTSCTANVEVAGHLNHEVAPILEIAVRVTDRQGLFKVKNFNITVRDNNDQPSNVTISGSLEASVAENSPGAFIGELVTSDEDGAQSHSYNVLGNSNLFQVRRGRFMYLKHDVSLNFEIKNKYIVIVTSTDDGSPPMTSPNQTLTVHVTDINEAPVEITIDNTVIAENSASGTAIGNFNITDPDNFGNFQGRQIHVCRLTDSAQGKFRISSRNGQNLLTQSAKSLDYEQAISHRISVLCSDPRGLGDEKHFIVNVSDVNEAPLKVLLTNTQIAENIGPVDVGALTTQDPDNARKKWKQHFNYTLQSFGVSPFEIHATRNILRTTRWLNYESTNSWTVIIRSRDNGNPSLYRDETFVVDVLDVNDKPTAIQVREYPCTLY